MTTEPRPPTRPPFRFPQLFLAFCRWLAEPERLPSVAGETPGHRVGSTGLAWLTSADHLPGVAQTSPGDSGLIRWLVAQDVLPDLSETQPRRSNLLSWLVAGEQLPAAEPPAPAPSRSFLRWLLSSEPTQQLADLEPPKEISADEP